MKKCLEAIKKVLMWLGAVFVAIFTVLFIGECQEKNKKSDPVIHDASEEIKELKKQNQNMQSKLTELLEQLTKTKNDKE